MMMTTQWRPLLTVGAIVLALALVGAGCGGDDNNAATEPGDGTEVTQTDGEPTDGQPASPATDSPEVTAVLERASGDGCTPPSADSLPDGRWFGYIGDSEDDAGTDRLVFDLACRFEGDAAVDAANVFGDDPPDNDYYVRNENELLRPLPLSDSLEVYWLVDGVNSSPLPYSEWRLARLDRGYSLQGVWLTIEGGAVMRIEEQFVP